MTDLLERPGPGSPHAPHAPHRGPGKGGLGVLRPRRRSMLERRERHERRWRTGPAGERPSRSLLVALLLAAATLATIDLGGGADGPLAPVRSTVADVLGPAQGAVSAVARPVAGVPQWFGSRGDLQDQVAALEAENTALRAELHTVDFRRNRLADYDALTAVAGDLGHALVPARVTAAGPGQTFSRTVTIDAGSDAGVRPDQTVVSGAGLVGRVLRTSRTTATVLLVVDADSTVGARVGETLDMGFLRGRDELGDDARLDLELVDDTAVPHRADTVVTWGSAGGAPYVAGVPIGRVTHVYSSLRETSQRVVVDPFVDFGSLDVVGVVVPTGTASDRALVGADGTLGERPEDAS